MTVNNPKLKLNNKPFSKNLYGKGGFIKVDFFKITDGDTAVFKINGIRESVRLLVIDTPEMVPLMPYAEEAKAFLEQNLTNAKEIYLQSDKKSDLRDKTERKRLLAWVWVDGELINYQLVRRGLALVKYVQNEKLRYLKKLRKAEQLAKSEQLGIHRFAEQKEVV